MKMYLQFYRLYYLWFTLAGLYTIWFLISFGDILLSLLIKVTLYMGIYVLVLPSLKKHSCYFQNQGQSMNRLFLLVSALDFLAVAILCFVINLVIHA